MVPHSSFASSSSTLPRSAKELRDRSMSRLLTFLEFCSTIEPLRPYATHCLTSLKRRGYLFSREYRALIDRVHSYDPSFLPDPKCVFDWINWELIVY